MTTPPDDWLPFMRAIDARHGDLLPVSVFADYLDERGHGELADGLKWCVREGRVPDPLYGGPWDWWYSGDSKSDPSIVPMQLGALYSLGRYPSVSAAYLDLARAWSEAGREKEAQCTFH